MGQEIGLVSREKYWDERTDKEKIEFLGNQIEYLRSTLNRLSEAVNRQENHIHVGSQIFYGNGPISPLSWPNPNPLNRERHDGILRGPF